MFELRLADDCLLVPENFLISDLLLIIPCFQLSIVHR
jgi:hypothetical protein